MILSSRFYFSKQKKRPFGYYPKGLIFYRKSSVCKPSSVLDGYLSTPIVTEGLQRVCRDAEQAFCLISCTEWGLHARVVTKTCVGSYPAFPPLQLALRYISVALSLKSPSQDVILHSCSVVLGLSSWEYSHATVWLSFTLVLYNKRNFLSNKNSGAMFHLTKQHTFRHSQLHFACKTYPKLVNLQIFTHNGAVFLPIRHYICL